MPNTYSTEINVDHGDSLVKSGEKITSDTIIKRILLILLSSNITSVFVLLIHSLPSYKKYLFVINIILIIVISFILIYHYNTF